MRFVLPDLNKEGCTASLASEGLIGPTRDGVER